VALDQTLLQLLFLGVENGSGSFIRSLLDPPSPASVDAAKYSLQKLGAIKRMHEDELILSSLGAHLAGIPAPPTVGKSELFFFMWIRVGDDTFSLSFFV
jgi:ATP-dependent RNA helicase DHX57